MNEQPPQDKTLRELLNTITTNIDHDLATTIADVINVYINATKRHSDRSILGPEDASRILLIIHHIMLACQGAPDPQLIPGAPTRGKPLSNPA